MPNVMQLEARANLMGKGHSPKIPNPSIVSTGSIAGMPFSLVCKIIYSVPTTSQLLMVRLFGLKPTVKGNGRRYAIIKLPKFQRL